MSFCLIFMRHLPYKVGSKTPHARTLQKVRGILTWWWHLLLLHCLTINISLSLVLIFFCLFLRTSLLTSFLTSSHLSSMCIMIRWPVISSFFLQLSCGSFATSPSSFLTLLTSTPWVPSASILFNRTRPSFQLKRPQTKTTDHAEFAAPSSSTPSTSAPSSSVAGVTLEAIMAWDVSGEHLRQKHSPLSGSSWWFHSFSISFSRGFGWWEWQWWC